MYILGIEACYIPLYVLVKDIQHLSQFLNMVPTPFKPQGQNNTGSAQDLYSLYQNIRITILYR